MKFEEAWNISAGNTENLAGLLICPHRTRPRESRPVNYKHHLANCRWNWAWNAAPAPWSAALPCIRQPHLPLGALSTLVTRNTDRTQRPSHPTDHGFIKAGSLLSRTKMVFMGYQTTGYNCSASFYGSMKFSETLKDDLPSSLLTCMPRVGALIVSISDEGESLQWSVSFKQGVVGSSSSDLSSKSRHGVLSFIPGCGECGEGAGEEALSRVQWGLCQGVSVGRAGCWGKSLER